MRKRILATLILVLVFIMITGCIRSLHPIYTERDIVFEPSLIGRWDDDGEAVWSFSKGAGNSYKLVITDDEGNRDPFVAYLVMIEERLFIDLLPEPQDSEEQKVSDFYEFHFLPVHTFYYVKQIEPAFQMSAPDPDWLEKFLAEQPDAIQHEKIDNKIFLTAPTKDLQAFLIKHLHDEAAFGEPSNMKRLE